MELLIIPFLFISFFPQLWKKNTKEQLIRFLIGALYTFVLYYFILIDITVSGVFISSAWILVVSLAVDSIRTKNRAVILAGLLGVIYLFMACVFPFTIKKNLADMVQAKVSDSKVEDVNIKHIITVPLEYAQYKAEKVKGQIENYSYYDIGEYSKQKIGDELYWVAPIEFSGYFTSKRANTIPGYIKISAENESEAAELVTGYEMKYVPSAYFKNNLYRIIRHNFPNVIIMEASFEPDENGKPYYAVTYGHYDKFRSGKVVDGVILVDPENGKMNKYSKDKVPAFVDQIIPADVAEDYNNYYGKYKNGLINSIFTKKDVHVPTTWGSGEEVVGLFDSDGKFKWYTDHTILDDNATSMVGYSLMDGRTGEFVYYNAAKGLNGYAALEVVNKSFQKEQWNGTQPILYKIYGEDSWVIPVIDRSGLLREISVVHAETGKVFHAETKKQVFDKYKGFLALRGKGSSVPTEDSMLKEVRGKVLRVANIYTEEGNIQKILLENSNKVFSVNMDLIPYSAFTKEGDIVSIKYIDTEELLVTVQEFKNENLSK